MLKVRGNYSSCRSSSSENICSSSGGAHEGGQNRMKLSLLPKEGVQNRMKLSLLPKEGVQNRMKLSLLPKNKMKIKWWISQFHSPLNANVLLCKFYLNVVDQTKGSGAVFSWLYTTNSIFFRCIKAWIIKKSLFTLVWTQCLMHRCVISTMFGSCFSFFFKTLFFLMCFLLLFF